MYFHWKSFSFSVNKNRMSLKYTHMLNRLGYIQHSCLTFFFTDIPSLICLRLFECSHSSYYIVEYLLIPKCDIVFSSWRYLTALEKSINAKWVSLWYSLRFSIFLKNKYSVYDSFLIEWVLNLWLINNLYIKF